MTRSRFSHFIVGFAAALVLAVGWVAYQAPPCTYAAGECPVGSTNIFSQNIGIQAGTAYTATVTATPTADQTWTIPDNTSGDTFAGLGVTQTFSAAQTFGSTTTFNATATFDAGDVRIDEDLVVGGSTSATETLSNGGFTLGGDDLFVAGLAGVEGNVYTDGSFITGSTTTLADGSLTFSGTTPSFVMGNGGTFSWTDGSNTLLSLADKGTGATATVDAIVATTYADSGRSYTLTVCASNANAPDECDYTTDGTADDVQIQAAIDAVESNGGGMVFLSDGNFVTAATLTIDTSDTHLRGSGIDATTITTSASAAIHVGTTGGATSDVSVTDLLLASADGSRTHGLLAQRVWHARFNLSSWDFKYPVEISGQGGYSAWTTIDGTRFRVNQANGVAILLSNTSNAISIFPSSFPQVTTTGVPLSGSKGVHIASGSQNILYGGDFSHFATAIDIDTSQNTIMGTRIEVGTNDDDYDLTGTSSNFVTPPMGYTMTASDYFDSDLNLQFHSLYDLKSGFYLNGMYREVHFDDNWSTASTAGGSVTIKPGYIKLNTGISAAATGTADVETLAAGLDTSTNWNLINWSKGITLDFVVASSLATANTEAYVYLGKTSAAPGDPTTKGIGFRVDNLAVKGIAYDGSTLQEVDLGVNLTDELATKVTIHSDGSGNVTWYVNEVVRGTTASGPTGLSSANAGWSAGVTNNNTTDQGLFEVMRMAMWKHAR